MRVCRLEQAVWKAQVADQRGIGVTNMTHADSPSSRAFLPHAHAHQGQRRGPSAKGAHGIKESWNHRITKLQNSGAKEKFGHMYMIT